MDVYMQTAKGRFEVEIHGIGQQYDSIEKKYKHKESWSWASFSTQIISANADYKDFFQTVLESLPTAGTDTKSQFDENFAKWKIQQASTNGYDLKKWRNKPDLFISHKENIIDVLSRHMHGDNPSGISKMNVYLPDKDDSWCALGITVVYTDGSCGLLYGHHISRLPDGLYILISSCMIM